MGTREPDARSEVQAASELVLWSVVIIYAENGEPLDGVALVRHGPSFRRLSPCRSKLRTELSNHIGELPMLGGGDADLVSRA
jgi:hypothetical protein